MCRAVFCMICSLQEIAAEQYTSLRQYHREGRHREDGDWLEVQTCSNSDIYERKFKK
jgi:hypothetical protein